MQDLEELDVMLVAILFKVKNGEGRLISQNEIELKLS